MELFYSTYGLKNVDVYRALPRLRDIGDQGMEIAVQPGYQTEPANMDAAARKRLAAMVREM